MSTILKALPALALSLESDPFYQAITIGMETSGSVRIRTLEKYFEYSILEAQRTGRCVFASDPEKGCAVWLLPCSPEIREAEFIAKTDFLSALLSTKGNKNYHAIVDFMAPLTRQHVSDDAWYLSIVGVHPTAQGQGLGHILLAPTLKEANELGKVCYLETFTHRNINFYKRLGFLPIAEYVEPITGHAYVVMRRDADAAELDHRAAFRFAKL